MKGISNQLNPETQICSDHPLHLPSHIPRTLRHYNPRTLQRLDLLLRSPAAPADNGTGVAHGLARRGVYVDYSHRANSKIIRWGLDYIMVKRIRYMICITIRLSCR